MKAVVVGGGIGGLVLAHYLIKRGIEVELFEASEELGGLCRFYQLPHWSWSLEGFFHHFFPSDRHFKQLLEDLNLADSLIYRRVQTSVYYQGSIYQFDSPKSVWQFPHLSLIDKVRMGLGIGFLRYFPFWPLWRYFNTVDLMPLLIGKKSWRTIWQPLLEGKFGSLAKEVSLVWFWSRLKVRTPQLGYLKSGSRILVEKLVQRIEEARGKIHLEAPITRLRKVNKKWHLFSGGGLVSQADRVFLTLPLPRALDLIGEELLIARNKINSWRKLKMIGAATLVLRLKRPFLPGQTYWLNILDRNFPFIVIVEHTNFIEPKHYGNESIVYVGGYYSPDQAIFRWDQKRIFSHFSPYLRRINPSFERFLIDYRVFRSRWAQPIIPKHYSPPRIELEPNSLYWLTTHHIYPWDRGVNFAIQLAQQAARLV